ncbi:MAG: DUF2905 domain-containing protein [Acidobacteria bacterium]|nr:DUF2905 domain-containing protein [Acidobacteriota bacterium]
MEQTSAGQMIVFAGIALVIVGILVWSGALSWLGRLPGDIRIERDGFRLYVPITSMIVISIFLTALLAIIRRFR